MPPWSKKPFQQSLTLFVLAPPWYLELGIWNLALPPWSLELGSSPLVFGIWSLVFGS